MKYLMFCTNSLFMKLLRQTLITSLGMLEALMNTWNSSSDAHRSCRNWMFDINWNSCIFDAISLIWPSWTTNSLSLLSLYTSVFCRLLVASYFYFGVLRSAGIITWFRVTMNRSVMFAWVSEKSVTGSVRLQTQFFGHTQSSVESKLFA